MTNNFIEILDQIKRNKLTHISLVAYGLKDEDAHLLVKALENNKSVQYIDLSSNKITFEGASELLKAIKSKRGFKSLVLNNNKIDLATKERLEKFKRIVIEFSTKKQQKLKEQERKILDRNMKVWNKETRKLEKEIMNKMKGLMK